MKDIETSTSIDELFHEIANDPEAKVSYQVCDEETGTTIGEIECHGYEALVTALLTHVCLVKEDTFEDLVPEVKASCLSLLDLINEIQDAHNADPSVFYVKRFEVKVDHTV